MADDRPAWARRMYNERQARGWSQTDVIRAMRAHFTSEHHDKNLPSDASLLRQYKRWEAGEVEPDLGRVDDRSRPDLDFFVVGDVRRAGVAEHRAEQIGMASGIAGRAEAALREPRDRPP